MADGAEMSREQKREYLVGFAGLLVLVVVIAGLANSAVQPVTTLDVKDSFNQVLLTSGGVKYIESPSYATVLSQNVTDSCDAAFAYKTAGLLIEKTLAHSGDTLYLSYQIAPWKANTTLDSMNVTLWIPYKIALYSYHSTSTAVSLTFATGTVEITPTVGHLLNTTVGPDPVYGQERVMFGFSLNPSGDKVGLQMSFSAKLSCQQVLTTRPQMSGGDELILSMNYGLFGGIFS
jgi:hypothetical protein